METKTPWPLHPPQTQFGHSGIPNVLAFGTLKHCRPETSACWCPFSAVSAVLVAVRAKWVFFLCFPSLSEHQRLPIITFLMDKWKTKWQKKQKTLDVPKWENCKNFICEDMTGVSLCCNNDCLLLYMIEQQQPNQSTPKRGVFPNPPRHDSTRRTDTFLVNSEYHTTTSVYIPM